MTKLVAEFYKDKAGKWRWRARSINGRIVADSGQGYGRKPSVVDAWRRFVRQIRRTEPRELSL